jgi:hypothetical protein
VRDSKRMIDAAAAARSAGVWLIGSLQRPTFDNMPTSLRNSFGQTWCFGVKDMDEAAIIMPETALKAGANPAAWGSRQPGYSYLVSGGTSIQRHVIPARSFGEPFFDDPDALTEHLLEHAHLRDPLDSVTAGSAGAAYAKRTVNPHPGQWATSMAGLYVPAGLPSARRPELAAASQSMEIAVSEPVYDAVVEVASSPAPRMLPAGPVEPVEPSETDSWAVLDAEDEDDEAMFAAMSEEELAELAELPPFESEEPDVAELALAAGEDDLPVPAVDFAFGQPGPSMTKEEAEAFVADVLRTMTGQGRTRITAKEMTKIADKTGKSPSWIRGHVSELAERGVLERVSHGTYEIVAVPEPV